MDALLIVASLSFWMPPPEASYVAQPAGMYRCEATFTEPEASVALMYPQGQVVEIVCNWPASAEDIWRFLWEMVMPAVSDLSQVADFYTYGNPEVNASWFVVLVP